MPTLQQKRLLLTGGLPWLRQNTVAVWKASKYNGTDSHWREFYGRSAFDARLGSASGADSNDPLFLNYLGAKYLYLSGANSNYASTPDAAALDITGDLDLRVAVAMEDWTPAAISTLLSKYDAGSNQRAYTLDLNTNGTLALIVSTTGVDALTRTSTVAPTVNDAALLLVRVTLDVDNGAVGNDVKFWTKSSSELDAYDDLNSNSGWTQLGATVTNAGTLALHNSNQPLAVGMRSGGATNPSAGKFYAAIVKNGIDGTLAFGADFTTIPVEPFETFVEKSANAATVTINRAATGRKSAMVDRKMFLLGTDDYFEIADHASLNFGATDPFTLIVVTRIHGTASGADTLISKKTLDTDASASYAIFVADATREPRFRIADGTLTSIDNIGGTSLTAGTLQGVAAVRSVVADTIDLTVEGSGNAATTDATTGSLTTTNVLRIGANGAGTAGEFYDGVIVAAAIFRRALAASEITRAIRELKAA